MNELTTTISLSLFQVVAISIGAGSFLTFVNISFGMALGYHFGKKVN